MSYQPQPGTVAARVFQHLKTLPPEVEITTPVLLDAIGQPSDWQGLSTALNAAVDAGAVLKRLEGRKAFWRIAPEALLADHTAIDDPEPGNRPRSIQEHAQTESQSECTRSHPHENMDAACQVKAEQARRTAADARAAEEQRYLRQLGTVDAANLTALEPGSIIEIHRQQDQSDAFECALTNTGRLLIDDDGTKVALSAEKAKKLMAYLDEQRGVVWEAA